MNGLGLFKAALASALAVFAFGFVFGTIRIFLLIPHIGPLAAVSVELPFMLAISVLVWRLALRRFDIPADMTKRLIAGLSAFIVLMALEFGLSWMMSEAGPERFISEIINPAGLLGLAGQIAFALLPLIVGTGQGKA